jgi:quercetin dioxygenase-like cupin family protein
MENAVSRAKKLAEEKLARGENADEFVEIAKVNGFKIYVAAGKTINAPSTELHKNPRDVFMLVLEGKIEFTFENGERKIVKAGECFVLPKHLKHHCAFKEMTVAIEGIYEKGL